MKVAAQEGDETVPSPAGTTSSLHSLLPEGGRRNSASGGYAGLTEFYKKKIAALAWPAVGADAARGAPAPSLPEAKPKARPQGAAAAPRLFLVRESK